MWNNTTEKGENRSFAHALVLHNQGYKSRFHTIPKELKDTRLFIEVYNAAHLLFVKCGSA
jgi:hypothetical protein